MGSREELEEALRLAETPSTAAEVGGRAQAWVREHIGTWEDHARRCLSGYQDLLRVDIRNVG